MHKKKRSFSGTSIFNIIPVPAFPILVSPRETEREDEHERRRDDIRSKTISSRKKEERHPGTERRKDVKASPVTHIIMDISTIQA